MDANQWYGIEPEVPDPALVVGDADHALQHFFDSCFVVGEEKCFLWSAGGPGEIRSRYDAVISKLRQRPANIPKFGLLEYPLFRSLAMSALFSPEAGFTLLALLIRDLETGRPSEALASILSTLAASNPSEAPLEDFVTGLTNGWEASYVIPCLDKPVRAANVTEATLAAVVDRWRSVSYLLGLQYSYIEIFCQRESTSFETIASFVSLIYVLDLVLTGEQGSQSAPKNVLQVSKYSHHSRERTEQS